MVDTGFNGSLGLPRSLMAAIALTRIFEEESFDKDSWLAVLLGDMLDPLRVLLEVDVDQRGDRRTTIGAARADSSFAAAAAPK